MREERLLPYFAVYVSFATSTPTWPDRFAVKQESGDGMEARNNTLEGQYSALIPTNKEHPQGEIRCLLIVTSSPVDDLCGSGLDRLLHPPGNDEEPDAPRNDKDISEERWDCIGCRETF
jgi:hypothetical protein